MKKIKLLPHFFTGLNLTCGLLIIFKLTMIDQALFTEKAGLQIVALLLLAGVFDVLDGAFARAMDITTEFGGLFDSLADAITFSVAPCVLVMKTFSFDTDTWQPLVIKTAALVFAFCGVLRLVRFNLEKNENSSTFIGLPLPASAAALVSLNCFLLSPDFLQFLNISEIVRLLLVSSAFFILGYWMICRRTFFSIRSIDIHLFTYPVIVCIAFGAVFFLYGLLNHFPLAIFILSWCYIVHSLILGHPKHLLKNRFR